MTSVQIGGQDSWALHVLNRLFDSFPNTTFLPHCTQLELLVAGNTTFDSRLEGELIRRCKKLIIRGNSVEQVAYRNIAQSTERLQDLEVDSNCIPGWLGIIAFRNLHSLRSVSLPVVVCWKTLSSIPYLESLVVRDTLQPSSWLDIRHHLNSLRHLHCSSSHPAHVVEHLLLPSLESFHFTYTSRSIFPIKALFGRLGCIGPNLRHFLLETCDTMSLRRETIEEDLILPDDLLPLSRFTNMRRFEITGGMDFALDESILFELVISWRDIEVFSLPCIPSTSSFLTMESLVILASSCPTLRILHLPLSKDDVHRVSHPLAYTMELGDAVSIVSELNIGVPPCLSPPEAAEFLFHVFPHLTKLADACHDATLEYLNWAEVVRLVETRFDPVMPPTRIQFQDHMDEYLSDIDDTDNQLSNDSCSEPDSQDDEWVNISTPSTDRDEVEGYVVNKDIE